MSNCTVLQADLDDEAHRQAIVTLINDYAREPIISGKPLSAQVLRDLPDGLKQHPTTIVLLAWHEEQAVGIAVCFLGFSTFAAKPLLNIHDFAVAADYRGQGIGRTLLAAAEEKARTLGCCKLTLEVNERNHAARRVYQAAGFGGCQHVAESGSALFLSKPL